MKFKNTADVVITSHDAMRVEYGVSGGCTRSPVSAAVTNGLVAQTGFVINGHLGVCGFTFTAKFGESTGDIASTNTQPSGISRTVIANTVVFEPALNDIPLIAGASQSFTRAPSPNPPTPFFLATQRTQKALRLLLHTPPVIPRLSTQITVSMLAPHALALIALPLIRVSELTPFAQ